MRRQDISSHDIDYVEQAGPCFTQEGISITCVLLMWRNDIKCKYMFMFSLKILARKGLMMPLAIEPSGGSTCNTASTTCEWEVVDYAWIS